MPSMLKETVSALKAGEMDFEGQGLAAKIMWNGMSLAVIVAIITGSITRSFDIMVQLVTIAAVLIALVGHARIVGFLKITMSDDNSLMAYLSKKPLTMATGNGGAEFRHRGCG
eukprot:Protomagalhaensia_wolfi_Nauph_80__4187@NODE_4263_length_604_cov_210_017699_g3393_i0_p1_GENE_NODE_4263_length_604_cov_210_017699_g3393_i0NODE_4263_length_604_cov_210_017699_g3393_i0_p1_ORF_typecomplete_len113_score16_50SPC12/PF06645_13/3_1e08TraQ/PF09679_10/0_049_NODE_4263_length_604_cov_210_017699_g3393_i0135473